MRHALFAALLALTTLARATPPVAVYTSQDTPSGPASGDLSGTYPSPKVSSNSTGSFAFTSTSGSTITTNGTSLTISTGATASGTSPQNLFFDPNGNLSLLSGVTAYSVPAVILTAAQQPKTPFTITRQNSTGATPRWAYYFANMPDGGGPIFSEGSLTAGTNTGVIDDAVVSSATAAGTISGADGNTIPAAGLDLRNYRVRYYDGTGAALRTVGQMFWEFDLAGGVSTQTTVSLPTGWGLQTVSPGAVTATTKLYVTSSGTAAIGLTAPTAHRLETTSGNLSANVTASTSVVINGNTGNNALAQNTALYVRTNLTNANGNATQDVQTAIKVEDSGGAALPARESYMLLLQGGQTGGENNRVVVDRYGDVGIGLSTPTAHMHISSGAAGGANIWDNNTHNTSLLIDGDASVAYQQGGSSVTFGANGATFGASYPVTISSMIVGGLHVSTQAVGAAGVAVTALCLDATGSAANMYATGGGCDCSGAIGETANVSKPNKVTAGSVPTGWTCQVSGGTGGACIAYALCSRLQ